MTQVEPTAASNSVRLRHDAPGAAAAEGAGALSATGGPVGDVAGEVDGVSTRSGARGELYVCHKYILYLYLYLYLYLQGRCGVRINLGCRRGFRLSSVC